MKKIISIILIMFSIGASAQNTVVKYKYCQVVYQMSSILKKANKFVVDYGYVFNPLNTENKIEVDTALDKVNEMKKDILMLNYMSKIGWECFNIVPNVGGGGGSVGTSLIYYFRKPILD